MKRRTLKSSAGTVQEIVSIRFPLKVFLVFPS